MYRKEYLAALAVEEKQRQDDANAKFNDEKALQGAVALIESSPENNEAIDQARDVGGNQNV